MIRERHLVPGRVLLRSTSISGPAGPDGRSRVIDAWVPCMVISFIPNIKRRHSREEAPREGWDVLVFWLDERTRRLESVNVAVGHMGWKVGW